MVTVDEMQRLLLAGADVVGPDGKKIGSVGQLFLDARTGEPAWVTVTTGLFGRGQSFVPLAGAVAGERDLLVGFDKDQVKHAPRIEGADGSLSPDEERELFRHYGLGSEQSDERVDEQADEPVDPHSHGDRQGDDGAGRAGPGHDRVGYDWSAPALFADAPDPIDHHGTDRGDVDRDGTDRGDLGRADVRAGEESRAAPAAGTADDGMVLRGERAKVIGTEQVPTERVRLRRYTVTENRTISVPVDREEYRVEYEPTGDDRPTRDDRPAGEDRSTGGDGPTHGEPPAPGDHDHHDEPRHRR